MPTIYIHVGCVLTAIDEYYTLYYLYYIHSNPVDVRTYTYHNQWFWSTYCIFQYNYWYTLRPPSRLYRLQRLINRYSHVFKYHSVHVNKLIQEFFQTDRIRVRHNLPIQNGFIDIINKYIYLLIFLNYRTTYPNYKNIENKYLYASK